jgi:hypothetical protein
VIAASPTVSLFLLVVLALVSSQPAVVPGLLASIMAGV